MTYAGVVCPVCGFELEPYPGPRLTRYPWAKQQRFNNPRDKSVFEALVHYHMPSGTGSHPSVKSVASLSEHSESSVNRAIQSLKASGWIVVHHRRRDGKQTSSYYEFRLPIKCPCCDHKLPDAYRLSA